MNLVIKTTLAVFVASIGFDPVSSFAQDASCNCATAAIRLSGGGGGFGPPEAIFDGVLLTSGVLSATQDDDNSISR
ncbi:hypothetical protein [Mesorhizobium sp. LjRoot246]|uniref:hypothetical protein n=1 Tax=Mesorhizobium sp. LjRoot246 TaxID=3342294 RepID=UPI003ECE8E7B